MSDDIIDALELLDVDDPSNWTADGLPAMDVMKSLTGRIVSRSEITAAARGFCRKNPTIKSNGAPVIAEPVKEETAEVAEIVEEAPEIDTDGDDKAEGERLNKVMQDAKLAVNVAHKALQEATAARDKWVLLNTRKVTGSTLAEDVKRFQDSQRKQREARGAPIKPNRF